MDDASMMDGWCDEKTFWSQVKRTWESLIPVESPALVVTVVHTYSNVSTFTIRQPVQFSRIKSYTIYPKTFQVGSRSWLIRMIFMPAYNITWHPWYDLQRGERFSRFEELSTQTEQPTIALGRLNALTSPYSLKYSFISHKCHEKILQEITWRRTYAQGVRWAVRLEFERFASDAHRWFLAHEDNIARQLRCCFQPEYAYHKSVLL